MARVHVIGAGVAGLSAAVRLADMGMNVVIHEQAAQAGGRARSFHDGVLDCLIDNGNHLLLSGNRSALGFLRLIGAGDRLTGPGSARFDFADLDSGERWSVDLNRGPVPLWVLYKNRRVPGTSLGDYLAGLKLLTAGNRTVAQLFAAHGHMYRRFWEPFSIAVLNTLPQTAAARLLVPVIRETLAKGADASQPLIAKTGLSDTFVDPALGWLGRRGTDIRFGQRVTGLKITDNRISALVTTRGSEPLGAGEFAVVAAPPWVAATIVPGLRVPDAFAPIVNVHFNTGFGETGAKTEMIGIVGGHAQWIFVRGGVVSVTVSAAHDMIDAPAENIIGAIWPDVARVLEWPADPVPPARVIKERRATFIASPAQIAKRSPPGTGYTNLVLAGDWIDTGLPATMEGAIRSGEMAVAELKKQFI